jgi:predicted Zn finger-like uncharacterized protein
MIIECPSCHARYRLNADRIRGRGARVRCRRCAATITVLLEARPEEAPPAADAGGFLDLGSAVRDSLAEPAAATSASVPAALPDNLIPFPGRGLGQAAAEAAPSTTEEDPVAVSDPPATATDRAMEEVDTVSGRLLPGDAEDATAAPPPPEERTSPEPAIDGGAGGSPPAEPAVGAEFSGEPDIPFLETHRASAEGAAPSFPGEGGFLLSDSDTLDFLKEGTRGGGPPPAGEKPGDDISPLLSEIPVDERATSLRAPSPAEAGRPAFDISSRLEPAPAGAPADETTIERNETPMAPPPEIAVPPFRDEPPPPARAEIRVPAREEPPASRTGSSASRTVAAGIVLLALAGAGYYFGFTPAGKKTLETAVPGMSAMLGGRSATEGRPGYDVRNVIGYYDKGAGARKILIIKGQVTNLSAEEKSGIRVFTTILDPSGKVLAEKSVYAGNVIPGDALKKLDPDRAAKIFDNRFGEGLANMHVGPGKSVPFMVVFFDAPESIDSYRLEARDSE